MAHWMTEGGMAIRAKKAAAKKAADEKHFKGLPWRCTVCEKVPKKDTRVTPREPKEGCAEAGEGESSRLF